MFDHDFSGWDWFGMAVGMVVFWALAIALVFWLVRSVAGREQSRSVAPPPRPATPQHLLTERFARGEIDEDEYLRRLAVLRGPEPHGPHPHEQEGRAR
ncbi:SHOCT domain-containing protein [Yinghuangia seranimata]|uniref:SHOCT domain-containing protein n=1 Tax=Yinghuangia seranimata TaxID=408067 RepID=UPI00248CCB5E|nr:SHOCT domain-containing protein [Yinghuangia seranimata]MDI2124778.1 SHOCT domain-containing protein [Yinghuangia seranimata]